MASGAGILFHVAAASLGLRLLMQTAVAAFSVIKLIGAGYVLWLGESGGASNEPRVVIKKLKDRWPASHGWPVLQ